MCSVYVTYMGPLPFKCPRGLLTKKYGAVLSRKLWVLEQSLLSSTLLPDLLKMLLSDPRDHILVIFSRMPSSNCISVTTPIMTVILRHFPFLKIPPRNEFKTN